MSLHVHGATLVEVPRGQESVVIEHELVGLEASFVRGSQGPHMVEEALLGLLKLCLDL
jgi:hypothetical protein